MRTPLGALIPLLLLGCTKDDTDDTGEVAVHPCLEGCWADAPSDALYVCEEGDDAAVGSAEAPLLTIAAAVEASREEDAPRSIRIGGGTYVETLSLYTAAGTVDDGLSLTGCAAEEAVIQAEDDDAPVIKVSAVDGLSLADLTLKGGRRALWIWQGAQVTVDGVIVEDSTRVGVVIDGSTTLLTADGLEVHDVWGHLGYEPAY